MTLIIGVMPTPPPMRRMHLHSRPVKTKEPDGAGTLQEVALLHLVVEVARDHPARLVLDGELRVVVLRRGGGDGVAASDRLAVGKNGDREELPGQVGKRQHSAERVHQPERLYVRRLLEDAGDPQPARPPTRRRGGRSGLRLRRGGRSRDDRGNRRRRQPGRPHRARPR